MSKQFKLTLLSMAISSVLCAPAVYAQEDANTLPRITLKASKKDSSQSYIAKKTTASKVDAPANEVAQSVSVITRKVMDDQAVKNINEAVRYSAGVLPAAYGHDPRYDWPFLRGYSAINDIWRDGLRHVNMNFLVPRISQYGIEQVEVLKGPASVLYGQGNPGGLISLTTKRPTDKPLHEVGLSVGSYNNYQLFADSSERINEQWKYRLTVLGRKSDSMIRDTKDDSFYIAPALSWTPDDKTELVILSQYQNSPIQNAQSGTPSPYLTAAIQKYYGVALPKVPLKQNLGNPDYDKFDSEYASLGYALKHQFNPTWTFKQNARYEYMNLDYARAGLVNVIPATAPNNPQPGNNFFVQQSVKENEDASVLRLDQNLTGQWKFANVEYTFTPGIDLYWLNGNEDEKNSDIYLLPYNSKPYPNAQPAIYQVGQNDITNRSAAIYALNRFKINDHWILNASGRYDWNSVENEDSSWAADANNNLVKSTQNLKRTDKEFSGQLSAMYLFDNGLSPYISYSNGFTPTTETDAGKLLKPETSQQVEAGLKWLSSDGQLSASAAAYQLTKQDVIRRNPVTQQLFQTGEVETKGLELESNLNLPYGFQLIGSYTYNDAEVTKDDASPERIGSTPLLTPKHQANLWLNYTAPQAVGLTLGLGVRHTGKMDYLDDNAVDPAPGNLYVPIHLDSRTLLDAAIGYQWNGISLNFKVNNLSNKEYFSWCTSQICQYDEERNYFATVKYRW